MRAVWRSLAVPRIVLGLVTVATVWWIAGVKLEAQGAYCDELHQAAPAFTWVGSPPEHFCAFTVAGLPLLNMPYSGAIKTTIYGVYLRLSGKGFTLAGWRRLGLLLTSVGILLCVFFVGRAAPVLWVFCVMFLLATDSTVLLASRHDWGPVALALLLRLMTVGLWWRSVFKERPSRWTHFGIGVLIGLSLFEKLSSLAFAVAMIAALAFDPRRRGRGHVVAVSNGLVLGGSPLFVVNLLSWVRTGTLVSLSAPMAWCGLDSFSLLHRLVDYLSLGAGRQVEKFILDWPAAHVLAQAEATLIAGALGAAMLLALKEGGNLGRAVSGSTAAYCLVFLVVEVMPRATWVHHWIIGTPFQYVAVAGGAVMASRRGGLWARGALVLGGIWLVLRLLLVGHLAVGLEEGLASRRWDPSLNSFAAAAARVPEDSVFLAADWGVSPQIFCWSQGRAGIVREPLWGDEWRSQLADLEMPGRYHAVHLVVMKPPSGVRSGRRQEIVQWMETRPGWHEVPSPDWLAHQRVISGRTFVPESDCVKTDP